MSSGSGTMFGYSVEGRSVFTRPETINGQIFDERWATIEFSQNPIVGVPVGPPWTEPWLRLAGLYDYASAQALRWWFHANSAHKLCVETRLVKHELRYSWEANRLSEYCLVSGDDRSSMMPDYKKVET